MLQNIPITPRKVPIILIVTLIIKNSWQPLGGLSHSVIKQDVQDKTFNVNIIYKDMIETRDMDT